ncbi:MAG: rod-binding protein [Desulfatiglandales bacterium]
MLEGIVSDLPLTGFHEDAQDNRVRRACAEFESIFITYMLKSMRNTVVEGGLLAKSNEGKIIDSMFDEKLGLGIANSGGIGIGKMLFEQLKG